jgi:ketosteroid isomerase-like protein
MKRSTGGSGAAVVLAIASASFAGAASALTCPTTRSDNVPAGILQLHRQDRDATLSGSASALAQLWTQDAVRMEPGGPAEVGKVNITAKDKKEEMNRPRGAAVLSYEPQICNVEVIGDHAVEWGYFRYVYRPRAGAKPQGGRAKMLRVLRRQADGSWKFSHVIWNPVSLASQTE